jgi:N-acetylmuramoyl-L-alanine amidase
MKNFFKLLSDFFASLFGGKKSTPPPTEPMPQTKPQTDKPVKNHDRLPDLVEDSSDVPRDTIITINEKDIEKYKPTGEAGGPFSDKDKEEAIETPEPEPGPSEEKPAEEKPASGTATPPPPPPGETKPPAEEKPAGKPKPAKKGRFCWCLDNGHGKLQAGKRSPLFDDGKTRFFEYEFNRDVVERIIEALEKQGVEYYDIVPDYLEVGSFLPERVERANKKKSDLPKIYVSVHANAGPAPDDSSWVSSSIKGIETWFAQNSTKGKKIAAVFQKHLIKETGLNNRNLKSTAEKPLYVLEKTIMPAVLTENGFYNNKTEVKELMKPEMRQKIADAHVAAILEIEKNGIV